MRQGRFLFRNLFRRHAVNRDLDAELGAFADEMNVRQRHSVRVEQVREEVRGARLGAGIESCARDLRYAARMLRKALPLTLACVATFAVGIGANTAVFSVANVLLWRKPPVENPGQLAFIKVTRKTGDGLANPEVDQLRDQTGSVFSDVGAATFATLGLSVDGRAQPLEASYVTGNFFALLGIKPELGQFFFAPGATVDRDPVLVLSHAYWQSRFLGDRGVIGRHAVVNGRPVAIIGVAPPGFHGLGILTDTQGYLPAGWAGAEPSALSDMLVLVRKRPGVGTDPIEAKLAVVAASLARAAPVADVGLRLGLVPMGPGFVNTDFESSPFPTITALFLTLSGLVLLLAAANIMGLLLARARVRQREMAVRSALGARRGRLARQVMLETLLLAGLGCAAGLAVGVAAGRALQSSLPPAASASLTLDLRFDWRLLLFGLAMGLIMALVAGVVPAWRAAGADPNDALRGEQDAGLRRQWLRSGLVAGQVAVSLALLIAGGLFTRSLGHARATNLGFVPGGVWNFTLDAAGAGDTTAQGEQFYAQLLPRVRALPGVASASLAQAVPFGEYRLSTPVWTGSARPAPGLPEPRARYSAVSPGYFETMRVPLRRGRAFTDGDDAAAPVVAVVNQAMAARYWPGQNPIGRFFIRGSDPARPLQVVGVAGDMRTDFAGPVDPFFFTPLAQGYLPRQVLQVRAASALQVQAVLRAVRQLDPNLPVVVEAMTQTVAGINGLFLFNLGARLALTLGLLGLFLATVGVYGVVAYSAAQRTREIGIRIALGARPGQVAGGIVRSALKVVGCGTALGLLLAMAIAKLVGTFLVGVSAFDPVTYVAAVAVLGAVALAASLRPAWRATRADPLAALRVE